MTKITDAEFEVISWGDRKPPPRRPWWQALYWLAVAGLAALAAQAARH